MTAAAQYPRHEISAAFQVADDARLKSMAEDIRIVGLRHPIVLYEDKILDGWCREQACRIAKVEPQYREFGSLLSDGTDPVLFVWSENGERRHLVDGQLVLSAQRLRNLATRMVKAARIEKVQRRLPITEDDAAKVREVKQSGCDELMEAMERGDVSAHSAAQIAQLDEDEQRKLLAKAEQPPARARREQVDETRTVSLALEPIDIVKLKAGIVVWERSVHAEVREAAVLLRRICPWV